MFESHENIEPMLEIASRCIEYLTIHYDVDVLVDEDTRSLSTEGDDEFDGVIEDGHYEKAARETLSRNLISTLSGLAAELRTNGAESILLFKPNGDVSNNIKKRICEVLQLPESCNKDEIVKILFDNFKEQLSHLNGKLIFAWGEIRLDGSDSISLFSRKLPLDSWSKRYRSKNFACDPRQLEDEIRSPYFQIEGELVGNAAASRDLGQIASELVMADRPVCIVGAKGTGKRTLVRLIHEVVNGNQECPFVEIDCSKSDLGGIEYDLCGGKLSNLSGGDLGPPNLGLRKATGGTLFLNEIIALSNRETCELLTCLHKKSKSLSLNIRIIATTCKDTVSSMKDKNSIVQFVNIPPLKDRIDVIPPLVTHFLKEAKGRTQDLPMVIDQDSFEILKSYDWPGNVRQLKKFVECLATSNEVISRNDIKAHLGPLMRNSSQPPPLPPLALVTSLLERHDWNTKRVAEMLEINEEQLLKIMGDRNLKRKK